MLLQHERVGYLFDPDNPRQLADAIQALQALSAVQKDHLCLSAIDQVNASCGTSIVVSQTVDSYLRSIQRWRPRCDDLWIENVLTSGLKDDLLTASKRSGNWLASLAGILRKRMGTLVRTLLHSGGKADSR